MAVKGAPILNDATLGDAEEGGAAPFRRVTHTGSGDIGVDLAKIPGDLREAIDRCTLDHREGHGQLRGPHRVRWAPPTAYLMAVKCPTIAEEVGVTEGSLVALLEDWGYREFWV